MNAYDHRNLSGKAYAGLLILICMAFFLWGGLQELLRLQREKKVLFLAERYAMEYGVDPYLVMAIMSVESNFYPLARGSKGEMGLMQLMPNNLTWGARIHHIDASDPNVFFKPEINIRLGCWYLSKLKKNIPNLSLSEKILLFAGEYNAGWNKTKKWLEEARRKNLSLARVITFPSTARYVEKVEKEYFRYKRKFLLTGKFL